MKSFYNIRHPQSDSIRSRFPSGVCVLIMLTTSNFTHKSNKWFKSSKCASVFTFQLRNITKCTQSQLSITLCEYMSEVRFTFALGAFLAPPLEPASDQAVIGAQILRSVGKKGHASVSTYTVYKLNWKPALDLIWRKYNYSCWARPVHLIFTSPHTCSASLFLL